MNAKSIYLILSILLGYGLIIGGFFIFGTSIIDKIKVLDIFVSIIVYTLLIQVLVYPLVNLGNIAHKEVGTMGIYFYVLTAYCFFAITVMSCGIIYSISFKNQLMMQLAIVFLLLLGRAFTLHVGEKVEQIYEKEQQMLAGKRSLRQQMDNFMIDLSCAESLGSDNLHRLQSIQEKIIFLTPSASVEAQKLEKKIYQNVEELKCLTKNASFNKERITDIINQLERILSKRKNVNL